MRKCVGCGYCCRKTPCGVVLGRPGGRKVPRMYEDGQACPELRWDGKRYFCQLVLANPDMKHLLAIGEGCCSSLNSDRKKIPSPKSLGLDVQAK